MRFDIHTKNYYDEDQILYEGAGHVDLEPDRIYAFVGCNGLGKSTLITQICQDNATSLDRTAHNLLNDHNGYNAFAACFAPDGEKDERDPDVYYLPIDRRSNARGLSDSGIHEIFSSFMSTGERTVYNLLPCLGIVGKELPRLRDKTLYLFLDDLDVGVSADVVLEERAAIQKIADALKANGTRYVICVAANNYELARGLDCISCADLSPVSFDSYEEYRDFVLSTRKWKDARDARNEKAKEERIRGEEEKRSRKKQEADERLRKRRGH